MKIRQSIVLIVVCSSSSACLNDRDSLAMENRRFPDMAQIIVGRFERNPSKYYELRIDRLAAKGALSLTEYDDLAVAYDRVGKDDLAVQTIQAKGKRMQAGAATKMDLYRYHANLGTFQAHRWLLQGAKADRVEEMNEAIRNIGRAIELNPDAHFGREAVQLDLMRWTVAVKTGKTTKPFIQWLGYDVVAGKKDDVLKGLLGLVALGAAWESVDVYWAMTAVLDQAASSLADFAALRVDELEEAGKKSLLGVSWRRRTAEIFKELHRFGKAEVWINHEPSVGIRNTYAIWRKNADAYHASRVAFLEASFAKGRHPDTDPNFWNGYKEVPPARWPAGSARRTSLAGWYWTVGILLVLGIGFLLGRDALFRRWYPSPK